MNTGTLSLDAEALYTQLRRGIAPLLQPNTRLVGIASGGVWLAERLHAEFDQHGFLSLTPVGQLAERRPRIRADDDHDFAIRRRCLFQRSDIRK